MFIETCIKKHLDKESMDQGALELTGNLGSVMKESAQLAYTFCKSYTARNFPDNPFMQKALLHLHVPEVSILSICLSIIINHCEKYFF